MDSGIIRTFLDLTKTLHISQTARNLYLSQSTVSQRLVSLEKQLGCELFARGRGLRVMSLTKRGESFIPLAQRWLSLTNEVERWIDQEERLEIEFGSHESINTHVLNDFYKMISEDESPHRIHLRIRSKSASELYAMLRRQEISLAMVVHPDYFENVDIRKLYSEPYALIPPAGISDIELENNIYESLSLRHEIFLPWDRYYWAWHSEMFGPAYDSLINVDIVPMLESFLEAKENWLIAPVSIARKIAGNCGRREYVLTDDTAPPQRSLYLIRLKTETKDRSTTVELFSELLIEWLKTKRSEPEITFHI